MRSTLRSLVFALGSLLTVGAAAQYPYYYAVSGSVTGCYPGQTVTLQTIQGTLPVYNLTIPLDSTTCTFSYVLGINSTFATIGISTFCGGTMLTGYDSTSFNFFMDTAYASVQWACGAGMLDCNGVLNGSDVPGSPCNDGNPFTSYDTWGSNCVCTGSFLQVCQASFTVGQTTAWTMTTDNTSTGQGPLTYNWWMPDGSSSSLFEPGHTFSTSGVYGICLTIADSTSGCSSSMCDTVYVDSLGWISNQLPWYDCLGAFMGNNTPGTPCDDNDPNTTWDTWSAACVCAGGVVDCFGWFNGPNLPGTACTDTIGGIVLTGIWDLNCNCVTNGLVDCLGVPNGADMPGTPCNDGDSLTVQDTWNSACICAGVFLNAYDCFGLLNGPDMPGAPCDDNDPNTSNDMWDANCDCVGSNNAPCQAGFWVLQGYTIDSLNNPVPIPNELWLWNLSSGGTGTYTFFWSFGDGTSSTDPFPTHMYANGGPYLLCLTIDDGAGCTSTYCDSVSVDSNGMYTGFTGGGGQRQQGFTINVQNQVGQGVADHTIADGIATWPNPALDQLNIALSNAERGQVEVTVTDANGRVMMTERHMLADGRNQLLIGTEGLASGLYLLRIANGTQMISQRFVKAN